MLISCLMATHGRHARVREALGCFLAQDDPACELVILNNHPVPLICDQPRVRVHNEPGYPTLGHCRNRLLELARGEFVRTWDDDDLYLPWTLSQGRARIGGHAAWKPARSWFAHGPHRFTLEGNAMEASILYRADAVRAVGYRESGGDEHGDLLGQVPAVEDEVGVWASYCYRWACGEWHISGSLGSGTIPDRTRTWVEHNQDARPGVVLTPTPVWAWWGGIAGTIDDHAERDAWLTRALGAHA